MSSGKRITFAKIFSGGSVTLGCGDVRSGRNARYVSRHFIKINGMDWLFERLVPVFMGESALGLPQPRQKGKRALVIAACTTPWPFNILARQSRGAVRSVREILGTGGMKVRTCEIPGTRKMNGKLSEKEARRITARTRRIVRKIE